MESEVWIINHCLGLGHETMVHAVALLFSFLCRLESAYRSRPIHLYCDADISVWHKGIERQFWWLPR